MRMATWPARPGDGGVELLDGGGDSGEAVDAIAVAAPPALSARAAWRLRRSRIVARVELQVSYSNRASAERLAPIGQSLRRHDSSVPGRTIHDDRPRLLGGLELFQQLESRGIGEGDVEEDEVGRDDSPNFCSAVRPVRAERIS